jgi:hypothetical protein
MSKTVWGAGVSFFIAIAIQFVSISDSWKQGISIAAGIGTVACVIGWYCAYRKEKKKNSSNQIIPVECGPDVKGSVVKANGFTFYRARIEPSGNERFPNLIAKVHSIKRDGVEMHLSEVLQIKYYPGDGTRPCPRKDDPAFLDVVFVNPNGVADLHVLFWPAGMRNWNFDSGHNYNLDVAILSDEISRRCNFEFVWTGGADTSSCRLILDGSKQPSKSPNSDRPLRPIEIRDIFDDLIQRGSSIRDQWQTTFTASASDQQREANSLLWLTEASSAVKKHLSITQFDRFNNYDLAMKVPEHFTFSLKVLKAGTPQDSNGFKIAHEVAGKLKILQQFRSEITRQPS